MGIKIRELIDIGSIAEKKIAKVILPIIKGEILKESPYWSHFDFTCQDRDTENIVTIDVKSCRALGGWKFSVHKDADSFLLIGFNNDDTKIKVVHIWVIYKIHVLDIIESLKKLMSFHPKRAKRLKFLYKNTCLHVYDNREHIDFMSKYERLDLLDFSNEILANTTDVLQAKSML